MVSFTSTGVFRTPDGKAVASSPSFPGRPPVPPVWNVFIANSGPPLSSRSSPVMPCPPRRTGFHRHEVPSAGTRSGMTWPRHPSTTSGSIWPMTWRPVTAHGCGALRIVPTGAVTRTGASEPALFGMREPMTQRTPKLAYASV